MPVLSVETLKKSMTTLFSNERAVTISQVCMVVYPLCMALIILTSHHGITFSQQPLVADFLCFWGAAKLALLNHAPMAYDLKTLHKVYFEGIPTHTHTSRFFIRRSFF